MADMTDLPALIMNTMTAAQVLVALVGLIHAAIVRAAAMGAK